MPDLITRAQWGARPPKGARNALDPYPKGVAVHWNGPGCAAALATHDKCAGFLRGIQTFHMVTRGWADIAYSLFACPHGYLFEGRGKGIGTAANGTNYGNRYYYAVYAMWGQGDGPAPAPLLNAIRQGIDLCQAWGAGSDVTVHNAFLSTTCPGPELTAWVKAGAKAGVAAVEQATKPQPTTAKKPTAKPTAPAFPLPRGHWYGVESRDRRNHSGYHAKDRPGIKQWQAQMKKRGWRIGVDGYFGPASEKVARQFQAEKGIRVDGAVGAQTWAAAWSEPVT